MEGKKYQLSIYSQSFTVHYNPSQTGGDMQVSGRMLDLTGASSSPLLHLFSDAAVRKINRSSALQNVINTRVSRESIHSLAVWTGGSLSESAGQRAGV